MKYAITLTIDGGVKWVASTRGNEPHLTETSTDAALFVQQKTAENSARDISKSLAGGRATAINVVGVEFTIMEAHPIALQVNTGFVIIINAGVREGYMFTGTKKPNQRIQTSCFDSKSLGRATKFDTMEQAEKRRDELIKEAEHDLEGERIGTGRNRDYYIKYSSERLEWIRNSSVKNVSEINTSEE